MKQFLFVSMKTSCARLVKITVYIHFRIFFNLRVIQFSSVIKIFSMVILCSCLCVCLNCAASYLKFCMFMNVFGPLSAEDEFSFVSHTNQVVLHGVTQKPEGRWESGHQYTAILCKIYSFINITAYKSLSLKPFEISQNPEHHCI